MSKFKVEIDFSGRATIVVDANSNNDAVEQVNKMIADEDDYFVNHIDPGQEKYSVVGAQQVPDDYPV